MPSRKSRARRVSRARRTTMNRAPQTLVFKGTTFFNLSYTSSFSFTNQAIKPSAFDRLQNLYTIFELYKITDLQFTTMPTSTGPVAMVWEAGSVATTPVGWTVTHVAELANSRVWYPGQTVPINLKIRTSNIANQYDWLATNDTLGPTGNIFIGGLSSTAVSCWVRMDYVIHFKQPVFTGKESSSEHKESAAGSVAPDEPVLINYYVDNPNLLDHGVNVHRLPVVGLEVNDPLSKPPLVRQIASPQSNIAVFPREENKEAGRVTKLI